MKYWDFADWAFAIFVTFMGFLVAFVLFVMVPVGLATDAACLEKGYPKSSVTWNLKRYCMNLSGSVTVNVEALK